MRMVRSLNSFGVMWNRWGTETAAGHWLLPSSSASSSSSSSHHHHQAGRWFEVWEETSPKKRLEKVTMTKEKKGNMRKKRVSKKNFNGDEENGEEGGDEQEDKGNSNISSNSFNGVGGGSVMEGSRCSRVNGRGWRCCQQTLVGYALCEHHLGKGRLRSMLNVRTRSSSNVVDNINSNDCSGEDCGLLPSSCKQWEDGDEGEEEKLMTMKEKNKNKKKRKRIGIVKARSISSLLCETHHGTSSTTTMAVYSNGNDILS